MFNAHLFFKQRLSMHVKETSRYLRYMFNGHIAVVMVFLISALAVYYQQWLAQLSNDFPASVVIGIGFGLVISYNPVRTLLKEPDLVFITVAEPKMKAYFRNALLYSFVIQLYVLLLSAAVLGPLYFHAFPNRTGKVYLLTLFLLIVFKLGNMLISWQMLKSRDGSSRHVDLFVRVLLNILLFYFIVNGSLIFATVVTILFLILFIYVWVLTSKQPGLNWVVLVEKEHVRMQFFYRMANMFAEVPHFKKSIKRRKWLTRLIGKMVPFSQASTYDYLYRLTFVRSGDYLGMYVRFLLLGGLLIYFVPAEWLKLIFAILFIYLSSFQLSTLYEHHRTIIWLDLYPIEQTNRRNAYLKWGNLLSIVQTGVFALLFFVMEGYFYAILVVLIGLLFTYFYHYVYMKRKLA
ncbi:ABC transporter permease [Virgibacillus sp. W0430]|uniref:ABC transporter permease n=1 Tax=Virgibacillus sp. W0430 TaxID=3391580 RepID=UPI003F46A687